MDKEQFDKLTKALNDAGEAFDMGAVPVNAKADQEEAKRCLDALWRIWAKHKPS